MPINGEADNFNNRCLFFESDDDRAVKCGCDKYMKLSVDSRELSEAAGNSWSGWQAGQTEALFNLCDENGEYISAADSPDNVSPESVNLVAQEPAKVSDLSTLMDCHLAKTDARNANVDIPQYHECTGSIATSNPTTRPTVSPTTSTASPTLPVAEIGGKPLVVDYSPWENGKSSVFCLCHMMLHAISNICLLISLSLNPQILTLLARYLYYELQFLMIISGRLTTINDNLW